jgi:hypothetical protein
MDDLQWHFPSLHPEISLSVMHCISKLVLGNVLLLRLMMQTGLFSETYHVKKFKALDNIQNNEVYCILEYINNYMENLVILQLLH